MRRLPLASVLAVTLFAASTAAHAQRRGGGGPADQPATAEPPAIRTMEQSAEMHAAAEGYWRAYEQGMDIKCANVSFDWPKATHQTYGKTEAAPDGVLTKALWIENVTGNACGESRRYRVLVSATNGHIAMQPLFPGGSISSPRVQDEMTQHLPAATRTFVPEGKTCRVDILDTKLIGGMPANQRQPWTEAWTVRVCGKRLNIPVRFVPDATGPGTSVELSAKTITVVP